MTPTLTIGRGGVPVGACTFGRRETSARSSGPPALGGLAVPVAAAERLGLERSPLREQLTGLAVLAVATALHRTWPATAFLFAAAPGIATSPSLFTLSYGSAPAVFAFLLGRRGTATGAALLSTRNGVQAASVACEAGLV
ncbi:hypothetical protein [Streptomyces sp. NPDC056982]|uniref:hypothetical protein n=1 Tax=Streptomyces sp. NPDC056982 TaxID=3345986 RepID=UPI00362A15F9